MYCFSDNLIWSFGCLVICISNIRQRYNKLQANSCDCLSVAKFNDVDN